MGYSFRLAARVLLYASSHRQDNTYHGLCYTSYGALAGTRNSSMGPPLRIDPTTHRVMSSRSYHEATSRSSRINTCMLNCNYDEPYYIGYSFRLAARDFLFFLHASSHRQNIAHTTAFVISVAEHWLEREIGKKEKEKTKHARVEKCVNIAC